MLGELVPGPRECVADAVSATEARRTHRRVTAGLPVPARGRVPRAGSARIAGRRWVAGGSRRRRRRVT
ncbi:hypothetical protein CSX11_19475, partial [Mycobacterium goodii]